MFSLFLDVSPWPQGSIYLTCPWLNQMASTTPSTAESRSAESNTITGLFPPSSGKGTGGHRCRRQVLLLLFISDFNPSISLPPLAPAPEALTQRKLFARACRSPPQDLADLSRPSEGHLVHLGVSGQLSAHRTTAGDHVEHSRWQPGESKWITNTIQRSRQVRSYDTTGNPRLSRITCRKRCAIAKNVIAEVKIYNLLGTDDVFVSSSLH